MTDTAHRTNFNFLGQIYFQFFFFFLGGGGVQGGLKATTFMGSSKALL